MLAVTDSELSPLCAAATNFFLVHDAEVMGFRTLTATMCLVQTLMVSVVRREEASSGRRRGTNHRPRSTRT